jgi:predicted permease
MLGVLEGCAVIAIVVLVGYLAARTGVGGPDVSAALNRVAFFVATPALLFGVLAGADLGVVFSSFMLVAVLVAACCAVVYVVVSRIGFRRPLAETTLGAAASIYVNSNNMGIPVATYVLHNPSAVAAALILQAVVVGPVVLGLLEFGTRGRPSLRSLLTQPLRTPVVPAAVLGILVPVFHLQVPEVIAEPIRLIGSASIPIVLLAFGMSLRGERPLAPGRGRAEVITAAVVKSVVMPVVAFLFARLLGLDAGTTFAVVVVAALPTGQIVYNYAARYERGTVVTRDTVLVTTIAAVPVMVAAAAFLA